MTVDAALRLDLNEHVPVLRHVQALGELSFVRAVVTGLSTLPERDVERLLLIARKFRRSSVTRRDDLHRITIEAPLDKSWLP